MERKNRKFLGSIPPGCRKCMLFMSKFLITKMVHVILVVISQHPGVSWVGVYPSNITQPIWNSLPKMLTATQIAADSWKGRPPPHKQSNQIHFFILSQLTSSSSRSYQLVERKQKQTPKYSLFFLCVAVFFYSHRSIVPWFLWVFMQVTIPCIDFMGFFSAGICIDKIHYLDDGLWKINELNWGSSDAGWRCPLLENWGDSKASWWLQTFFIFTPIWGRFPAWLIFVRWVETTNKKVML